MAGEVQLSRAQHITLGLHELFGSVEEGAKAVVGGAAALGAGYAVHKGLKKFAKYSGLDQAAAGVKGTGAERHGLLGTAHKVDQMFRGEN